MSGILQNNPWNYSPYTALGIPGSGSALPFAFGGASPFAPQSFAPSSHLPQLLQILPQQIQQLQQTMQWLPQHVAHLVVQTLIQSQALAGAPVGQPFQSPGAGLPFPSVSAGTPFHAGQPGYVM